MVCKKPLILIVDDDEKWLLTIQNILGDDYKYTTSTRGKEAIDLFKTDMFSLVIIDKRLEDMSGVEVLREMSLINANLGAIILIGYPDFDSAVESLKIGALDYVSKGDRNLSVKLKITVSKSLKKVFEKEEQ
jgi:DNA-binding NtrC family response regulator